MTSFEKCVPKQCGIRFSPPALIFIYESVCGSNQTRKRIMPIRNFKVNSNVRYVAQDLALRHSVLETVSSLKIEKMLRLLQEYLKGNDIQHSLENVNGEFEISPEEDLNKLETSEVKRKKEVMDESFNKNRVKPGDPHFVYDKRVEFDNGTMKLESGWDSEIIEETDDFWN